MDSMKRIEYLLGEIYGEEGGRRALTRIENLLLRFEPIAPRRESLFSESDIVLITYGDTLREADKAPIRTLHQFAARYLKRAFSAVHLLPFFPYSSDDGFSVMDFFAVNSELGDWKDVSAFEGDFALMFDFVLNHFSAQSRWFQNYLEERPGFEYFPIEVAPDTDLSSVTRPRALPLLTPFKKKDGRRVHLWTTFSADQIDFNYRSLDVLEKMMEVMLFYVRQGARILRLDAIAYLWKEIGTSCIHLPQTHQMVKLMRAILDRVAPDVMIITETNVPHAENVSYFGNGRDEAQMVYNFTLPPLLLHAFLHEDIREFSRWAAGLGLDSERTSFFNFTASHDGIGVRPLEGILPVAEIESLVTAVKERGGRVSYKQNSDGSQSPYELNITYLDAVAGDVAQPARKFLASQAIQYVLPGVPATYIHSLLGTRNWQEGVRQTGMARTINRRKLQVNEVMRELEDPKSLRSQIFFPYTEMAALRRRQPALHPRAAFEILDVDHRVFAIRRVAGGQTLWALTNVSSARVPVSLKSCGISGSPRELFSGRRLTENERVLAPFEYVWISRE